MIQEHLDVINAIKAIRPGIKFSFGKARNGDQVILPEYLDWIDVSSTKPTVDEIKAEMKRQADERYKVLRASEYPPLSDFADAMYWASKGDNTKLDEYNAKCDAVKLKYPKTEVI